MQKWEYLTIYLHYDCTHVDPIENYWSVVANGGEKLPLCKTLKQQGSAQGTPKAYYDYMNELEMMVGS